MAWRSKVKRDKTDILFSELVRERVNYTCERCGKNYRHDPGYVHCSHLWGRRKKTVRWHPLNAFCHCLPCHQYLGEHPAEFARWAEEKLGDRYERLMVMASKPGKVDKELIHKHYLSERKRMKDERGAGETGRIDFDFLPDAVK